MEPGSPEQGNSKAVGASPFSGESEMLMAALPGLLWIAQQPEDHGRIDPTSPTAVLLEVVQSDRLLQVCTGRGQLTKPPQALAHLKVTGHKERWSRWRWVG
jgi:hypothetical protein